MNKQKISIVLMIVMVVSILCSCGSSDNITNKPYYMPDTLKTVKTGTVASNAQYSLMWDSDAGCVILYDNIKKNVWSSTPYDYYMEGKLTSNYVDNNLRSPISITYVDPQNSAKTIVYAFDSTIASGQVFSTKIENGIRVVYFFKDVEISIPVEYILCEDGLESRILVNEITENKNLVYKISLLPFFSSAKNDKESYLFLPSGCGALMYTDDSDKNIRKYSEMVYGNDGAYQTTYQPTSAKSVRLPVFGVKNGDNAMLGIIENGSEMAYVEALAGDSQLGYSAAWATFQVRSVSTAVVKDDGNLNKMIDKTTENKVNKDYVSVRYIPVNEGSADYNGMADTYRSYLKKNGALNTAQKNEQIYLDILGGVKTQQSFFGIPYKTVSDATTIKEAGEILRDLSMDVKGGMAVNLRGFGKGGLDYSGVAGGFKIGSAFGNLKDVENLNKQCLSQNIPLFMDFDLIWYNSSGNGFSTFNGYAKTANSLAARLNEYLIVTKEKNNTADSPYFLSRENLLKAGSKLNKTVSNWQISGVSLASLGSVAYGDCRTTEYYMKNNMGRDVGEILNNLKKNGKQIVTDDANLYAAVLSDYVFNAPTSSSGYLNLDETIPFYQMIFKGNVAVSSAPINISSNPRTEFLKAMTTGSALEFMLSNRFEDEFISTVHSGIAGSTYSSVKDMIIAMSEESDEYLKAVNGANITNYEKNNNVSKTDFSNGVEVYVNYNSQAVETPAGTVGGFDFLYSYRKDN